MAQVGIDQSSFGGRYLVQDENHMSGIPAAAKTTPKRVGRQSEQGQTSAGQQGAGDAHVSLQQGGERRKSR